MFNLWSSKPPAYSNEEWADLVKQYWYGEDVSARQDIHWLAKEVIGEGTLTRSDYMRERNTIIKKGNKEAPEKRIQRMIDIASKREDENRTATFERCAQTKMLAELTSKPIVYARPASGFESLDNPTRDFCHHYGIPVDESTIKIVYYDGEVSIDAHGHCYKIPPDDVHPQELRKLELLQLLTNPDYQARYWSRHVRNPIFRVFFWETIVMRVKDLSTDPKERMKLIRLKSVWPQGVDINDPSLPCIPDPPMETLIKWGWFGDNQEESMHRFQVRQGKQVVREPEWRNISVYK